MFYVEYEELEFSFCWWCFSFVISGVCNGIGTCAVWMKIQMSGDRWWDLENFILFQTYSCLPTVAEIMKTINQPGLLPMPKPPH